MESWQAPSAEKIRYIAPAEPIILNPAVGRGGVNGFWGAEQEATTRNGATAQGGAVPSGGRCDTP
jgi:hypothetical protein